jgi:hypothetical protein
LENEVMAVESRVAPQHKTATVVGVANTDWVEDYARVRAGEKPFDSYGYGAVAFARAGGCGADAR